VKPESAARKRYKRGPVGHFRGWACRSTYAWFAYDGLTVVGDALAERDPALAQLAAAAASGLPRRDRRRAAARAWLSRPPAVP